MPISRITTISSCILINESTTRVFDMGGLLLHGIEIEDAWTTASLGFLGGAASTAMHTVYTDSGGELLFTAGASRMVVIDPTKLSGTRYLQLRSGCAAAATNQVAQRPINLMIRPA